MLAWISYRDYREHSIYDADLLKLAGIALISQVLTGRPVSALLGSIVGLFIGLLVYYPSFWIYKEEAFGFGDVLLLGVLGLVLGLPTFIYYFIYSIFLLGFMAATILVLKPEWHQLQLPLAPGFSLCLPIYLGLGSPTLEELYKFFYIFSSLIRGV